MRKSTFLMILGIGAFTACNTPEGEVEDNTLTDATEETAVVYDDEMGAVEADGMEIKDMGEDFWSNVDWDAPVKDDPAMKNANIELRSTDQYNIYTMDDRLLFDTDKAQIRTEGERKLEEIVNNIKDLPKNGQIRIFGHADSRASNEYNKELSAERARAVQSWFQNNGGINAKRISIEAMGETEPRATNETARGRQLNRRVAIVVVTRQQ
jgi:outer membrane protein OmpA-like peptidoglycan-associated protein